MRLLFSGCCFRRASLHKSYWTGLQGDYWAVRIQAPPTALIFSSALLEKKRALTMTGCLGSTPLPSTLKNPALEQSITGALSLCPAYLVLVCNQGPQLVQVDAGLVEVGVVGVHVEVPHADLAEVPGMVLVEVDAVVMLATGVTATSGVLPVLSDPSVTVGHMSSQLPGLLLGC